MTTEISSFPDSNEHVRSSSHPHAAGHGAKEERRNLLLDLLIVLAERKRFIFWVTAGFAILAIVISLLLPMRYTATVITADSAAKLLDERRYWPPSSVDLGGMAALAGGGLGLKNPNDMFVGMLRSRTVEDAMVQHFGLMQEYHKRYLSDARKKFEHDATVDGSGKDGLIHISVEDRDPRRAAELANGYVDQFRDLSQHLAITEASQRRLFFEQELEQAKNNLATPKKP